MMIDLAFCAVVATTRPSDYKPADLRYRVLAPVHINRCLNGHSAFARLENISHVPQRPSTELQDKSDLTILLLLWELPELFVRKAISALQLRTPPRSSLRIARPKDFSSQVTDDAFLSARQSQNYRKHGYPTKQRIETPAMPCRLFLPN
jgi:hypothetical protein